jgi:two-component sensor histidine kinase
MAKNEIWEIFDEVITIPITKAVLLARVKVLMQTRKLSVQVNQLMNDKEMLLKEIHHRVKNNLMVISSLLSMQSRDIEDEKAKAFFRESQNRAQSMALIHERLYRSTDLKKIDLGEYIFSLATDLFNTYTTDPDKIKLEIDVEEIMIDINVTIPLGLILNELITNSLKYAFPGENKGKLTIKFYKNVNEFFLIVSDDGVGIPEDFDLTESDSLGMRLIDSLIDQLDGELELEGSHGTTFRIKFPEKYK